jgi:hypothetical protein
MESYLEKRTARGTRMNKWLRRYFVLRGGTLVYYRTMEQYESQHEPAVMGVYEI